ncbi:ABC transporter ATP-binding protein [Calidifontibacillus oryziterrae]|uniref:ABC transporter ATP-binding protein n=1 Tax=Calidifontibacillus oryziterrae TaxID=1191699 RepID=UPI0002E57E7D|nr:ABC transporter ATP-binding protein [Calidifontibacillus oryziterrae]
MGKILEVRDLHVCFDTFSGEVHAVRGVDFYLEEGETLAIVGESGSGKSVMTKCIMRLLPTPLSRIPKGEILYKGKNVIKLKEKEMQTVRGSEISMIFQDPMTSLNPTMTIGKQITEGLMKHQNLSKKETKMRAIQLLTLVGLPNPEKRVNQYPHQFSGGMRQRVVIAMAIACNPKILIADEPTTALDVTIQSQILELMKDLQVKMHTSIIIITHDLGVVANVADRVAVMYAGIIIETGTVDEIFYRSNHPYTWGLLTSMPTLQTKSTRLVAIPGTPPDLISPPKGCPFASRCQYVMEVCINHMPDYSNLTDTHLVACWLLDDRAPRIEQPFIARGGTGDG